MGRARDSKGTHVLGTGEPTKAKIACAALVFDPAVGGIIVEGEADVVASRLGSPTGSGFRRFTMRRGQNVWVNPDRVLYVESYIDTVSA